MKRIITTEPTGTITIAEALCGVEDDMFVLPLIAYRRAGGSPSGDMAILRDSQTLRSSEVGFVPLNDLISNTGQFTLPKYTAASYSYSIERAINTGEEVMLFKDLDELMAYAFGNKPVVVAL